MESPHRLILASAGTGKTYQLSGRFLGLLLAGVEPDRILATTFTRKAAGEILDRVLERLVDAASDEKKRKDLSDQLRESLGRATSSADARALLVQLTRQIDRFRIRTLDAFFVQLAKLFALDLGLPSDWTIVDEVDDKEMRRDALGRALEATERAEMLALLRDLQRGDASRSIERRLGAIVDLGRSAYLDSPPEAWRCIDPSARALDERELPAAIDGLRRAEVPKTKAGKPNANWQKGLVEAAELAERGDWQTFISKGIASKVIAGEETYSRAPIEPAMAELFGRLIEHARHTLIEAVAAQNAATHSWLERFETAYVELKREQRAYRFEDLPQALAPAAGDPLGELELDIFYRLDARIDHLLLDEFQDTSAVQWRILSKVADEILSDGTGERSYFCVGDVKQSIYGWREAEPRLLSEQPDRYPVLSPPDELTHSYRSSHVVLDTVNRVFADVHQNGSVVAAGRAEAAAEWRDGFRTHVAALDLAGAAYLVEAPEPGEDGDPDQPPLIVAADRAAAIARSAPSATIGILLRRNKHLSRLIFLLRERGLRASGDGGNPLTDSGVVLETLALLHLADHPGDSAAAFHVASSPLAQALGFRQAGDRESDAAAAEALALRVRVELGNLGYGGFLTTLRAQVRTSCSAWDRKRFDQLIDLAFTWQERAGLRPSAFVEHVRATQVEDPSAEQIKVMTIHASKGLEFDAVILPELDGGQRPDGSLLTRRPDPAGLFDAVSVRPKGAIRALDAQLTALAEEQAGRDTKELLCVLYVAMTRAARRLDMIVRAPGKKESASFGALLRSAFDVGEPDADGVLWVHPGGDADCLASLHPEEPGEFAVAPAAPAPRVILRAGTTARSAPQLSPSGQEAGGRVPAEVLLRSNSSEARTRGTLIHRWFEAIEWLDDFDAGDAELLELAEPIEPVLAVREAALELFRELLETPAVAARMRRPSGADTVEVWRERPFALYLPAETGSSFWSGSFDRVVVTRRGPTAIHATVVDYKTDALAANAVDARFEVYRPQLEAYRRAVCAMEDLAPEAVEAVALFLAAGEERRC